MDTVYIDIQGDRLSKSKSLKRDAIGLREQRERERESESMLLSFSFFWPPEGFGSKGREETHCRNQTSHQGLCNEEEEEEEEERMSRREGIRRNTAAAEGTEQNRVEHGWVLPIIQPTRRILYSSSSRVIRSEGRFLTSVH